MGRAKKVEERLSKRSSREACIVFKALREGRAERGELNDMGR